MGIVGIVLALALLMFLAYRGLSLILLAPAMALLAAIIAGGLPPIASYTQIFMTSTGGFIITFFPLFLLGAVFGKLMDDSGCALSIANWIVGKLGADRSILAIILSCAILTYGGISLFVVAFAIAPIGAALFRQAAVPKRLLPAAIALGSFTFTMTALPGTPAIQNAIPMPYFGTTPFAAPGLGIISGLIMFVLGLAWLTREAKRAKAAGEGYGDHEDALPQPDKEMREQADLEGFDVMELEGEAPGARELPPFVVAFVPIVLVILVNFVSIRYLFPAMDTSYLADPLFGETTIVSVQGLWAVILALTAASLLVVATNWTRLSSIQQTVDNGANASVVPIFNTASLVGFGAVIAAIPAFELVRDWVIGVGGDNPLISVAVAMNLMGGITGSASGGMSIALGIFGETYAQMAKEFGIAPELMHRVTSVASGGLATLPHNGAVISLLLVCGLGHKESYKDIFVVSSLGPLISLVVLIVLGTLFGAF